MCPTRFYGHGLPGVDTSHLLGKLVVVEGSDGSGRSTQVALLRDRLERGGHATIDVGLSRSTLVANEIEKAKQGNILNPVTLSLFYATDFADQIENRIIPALRAGFVVLADRYIYTLMARDIVRGADPQWVQGIYDIALVPDVVFYLRVSPARLAQRCLQKSATLDYWESGMDIGLARDLFHNFMKYQKLLNAEFGRMARQYDFRVINGNRSIRSVAKDLQAAVLEVLEGKP
ncbi:MAG: thymidylate kinase [Planctomycetota bacterium]